MNIRAIGFDYGGVIEGKPGSVFEAEACAFLGITIEDFKKIYFRHNLSVNTGEIPWDEFWRVVLEELGRSEQYESFLNFLKNQPQHQINSGVVEIVRTLRGAGYKTGILSNNSIEKAREVRASEIARYFDVMVFSEEIGHMKPHREAFDIFVKELGVSMPELAFIDDTQKSIERADEFGFYPILFTDEKTLTEDLGKIGIKI